MSKRRPGGEPGRRSLRGVRPGLRELAADLAAHLTRLLPGLAGLAADLRLLAGLTRLAGLALDALDALDACRNRRRRARGVYGLGVRRAISGGATLPCSNERQRRRTSWIAKDWRRGRDWEPTFSRGFSLDLS